MEAIKNYLETQSQVAIILGGFFLAWFLASFFSNIAHILEAVAKGYLNLIILLKKLLSLLLLPFKLIGRFFSWIANTKNRREYKKYLLSSIYNVNPGNVKIPLWRKIISRKIRREERTRLRCIEQCMETQEFINNNLKYITMIETSVGGGKSSLMACLSHSQTIHLKEMIQKKIVNTRKILYDLAWNQIDEMITEAYKHDTKIKNVINTLLENEELGKYFNRGDKSNYNNYRSDVPLMTLLVDYVTAYCALERNNYVMANYRLKNRLTNKHNYKMPPNLFDITTPEGKKNYYIPAYCVIAEDEVSLTKLKNTSSPKTFSKSGRDKAMRIIRHLKKETTFYMNASQKIGRIIKLIKELGNTYIEILELNIVGAQKTYSRIFQKKEQEIEEQLTKEKDPNKFFELKKKRFELYQEQNKVLAASFLQYKVLIGRNIQDIERLDKSKLTEIIFTFPITWGYGVYNTCELNDVDKRLMEISGKSDIDLEEVKSLYEKIEDEAIDELIDSDDEEPKKKSKKKEGEE